MRGSRRRLVSSRCAAALLLLAGAAAAQPFSESLFSEMRWRMIGPFRGGRTVAASGIPGNTNVYYAAASNGGVWKTTDAGRVWRPVFDEQPTGSIGALAVSWSRPERLWVGTGEGLQRPDLSVGNGMYRSDDGGKTWTHLGLDDAQQIAAIATHPKDADRALVAVLGHPYGANETRGVYLTRDAGKTWERVLWKDADTGGASVAYDPKNPEIAYAALWSARQGPWENGEWEGPGTGLYKSADGGTTWKKIGKGLPGFEEGGGRIGFGIAPSDPARIYATVDGRREEKAEGGIFVSNDAGETFTKVNGEKRLWGRGSDFAEIRVAPRSSDEVWIANTSVYRSADGGKTFTPVRGAPGGDDFHTIWFHPESVDVVLMAADQGAIVTVNGGATWSSWYNQPTAQLYHVSTDNRFPYWVYGGQQESGSVGIASRGDYGAITERDWHPVAAEEYGYVAPDPKDADVVFGGKLTRFRHSTADVQDVSPAPLRGKVRFLRTAPVVFSPADPRLLFYAGNVVFRTADGGRHWDVISPDLSREKPEVPASIGVFFTKDLETMKRRGVVYTLAPGYKDANVIWAGTDDGLVHRTADGGKTWTNVTPPSLTPWSKVSMLEASPHDDLTAYAAINRFRLDDLAPHVLATHDGGKTWTRIVNGLPNDPVNAVREDPVRKGLLYAATERMVCVSFDDGAHWQPLRLDMPATSVRDLVVKGDDLVIATHGRSFWILDDVTPLRELSASVASARAHLFAAQTAVRVRRSRWTDTPVPPEEPAGENPPDGAILDYVLAAPPAGPVVLEIKDAAGAVVRRYASDDKPEPLVTPLVVRADWARPARVLPATPGMHRFVWDLRYAAPDVETYEYPISAVPGRTPKEPEGPLVLPGVYTAALTVDGTTQTRPLTVAIDPRLKATAADLAAQGAAARRLAADLARLFEARKKGAADPAKAEALEGKLVRLYSIVQESDDAPTPQLLAAAAEVEKDFKDLAVKAKDGKE
ncbi:MAG TPA: glycoside hydrolase [Thermoanaerobaculia bacterium]